MGLNLQMAGDWQKAAVTLKNIQNYLGPVMDAVLLENGELVLRRLQEHIDRQDLNWTPLSRKTVELKGGSTTIYVETGFLRDNLEVRRITSNVRASSIMIGASPWKVHEPSGEKMSKIMSWLEYGTDRIPPRPLVRPTFDEIRPIVEKAWKEALEAFIRNGGEK
jgi:hypothetical protein